MHCPLSGAPASGGLSFCEKAHRAKCRVISQSFTADSKTWARISSKKCFEKQHFTLPGAPPASETPEAKGKARAAGPPGTQGPVSRLCCRAVAFGSQQQLGRPARPRSSSPPRHPRHGVSAPFQNRPPLPRRRLPPRLRPQLPDLKLRTRTAAAPVPASGCARLTRTLWPQHPGIHTALGPALSPRVGDWGLPSPSSSKTPWPRLQRAQEAAATGLFQLSASKRSVPEGLEGPQVAWKILERFRTAGRARGRRPWQGHWLPARSHLAAASWDLPPYRESGRKGQPLPLRA